MKKIIIAYTGDTATFNAPMFSADPQSAMRIEAVFSNDVSKEKWEQEFYKNRPLSDLSFIELKLDPVYSDREDDLFPFKVQLDKKLNVQMIDIIEGEVLDSSNRLTSVKRIKKGGFEVFCFARDLMDAGKVGYREAKISLDYEGSDILI